MKSIDMQYYEQQQWWSRNKKVFKLMALPLEMREVIYLHAISPIIAPALITSPTEKLTLGFGQLYNEEDAARTGRNRDPNLSRPNMSLMLVSKQVRTEATVVAHRDTLKRFSFLGAPVHPRLNPYNEHFPCASDLLTHAPSLSPHASFLRNIQLEMSAAMYFAFVGIRPRRGEPLRAAVLDADALHISALKGFTSLQSLDFRFVSPKNANAMCPWMKLLSDTNSDKVHSCQKVWIEWFFVFAWDALRALYDAQIARLDGKRLAFSLSGCVKASTRTYWERLLNDRRGEEHTEAVKGMEKRIREGKVDHAPIACKCSNLCGKGGPVLFDCTEQDIRLIEGLREEIDKAYWDFEE